MGSPTSRAPRHAFVLVVIAASNLAVELVHGLLVLPARARPEGVPTWQWLVLFAPLLVGIVVAARALRDAKDVALATLGATAVVLFEKHTIAALGLFPQPPRDAVVLLQQGPRIAFGFAVLFALAFAGFRRARDQRT